MKTSYYYYLIVNVPCPTLGQFKYITIILVMQAFYTINLKNFLHFLKSLIYKAFQPTGRKGIEPFLVPFTLPDCYKRY